MTDHIHKLITYRDLFLVFIWREFNLRYKQTTIGVLWAVIQPLSMMILFTFVFTVVMPTRISDFPYPLFFYAAILPWTFFSSSLSYAVPSLASHYDLVTKIYFPREIIPLAGMAVAVVDYCIAFVLFFILLLFYGLNLHYTALWVFPLTLLLVLLTAAICLILSALNVYYRDVRVAIGFAIQLWFFATPVFYSIDAVKEPHKILLFLNPLTFIVENMRRCLLENRPVVIWQYALMFLFIVLLFLAGYLFFKKTEEKFADVI